MCNGPIRGIRRNPSLLGVIHFWFGYISDTSTSDSKNTEVIRSVWDL